MNKTKLITSVMIIVMAFGIQGFTNAQDRNLDPIHTINRINSTTSKPVGTTKIAANPVVNQPVTQQRNVSKSYITVTPVAIVQQPKFYLGKNVKFKAKFDKFSTLGLDYRPAFRSSEKYISLLIQRPDIPGRNIPFSELKIFVDRESAEKHIDLNAGDEIEISGHIFSIALGDPWMSVEEFNVLKSTQVKIK